MRTTKNKRSVRPKSRRAMKTRKPIRKRRRVTGKRMSKGITVIPKHQSDNYNEAYNKGFDEAYNEGFDVGYAEGVEAGHQEAYKGEG
ncbi:hypothetical protein [Paenibacillus dakarensis]|uniref:hypothetical protein n=1 Tax=Paenibacillus dakarensis TaxID=1527293 RepID=UPI0006D56FC8|nr:hypothetical protein [Paenibacillus dakarensis]